MGNVGSEAQGGQKRVQATQLAPGRSRTQACYLNLLLVGTKDPAGSSHQALGHCPNTGPAHFLLSLSREISPSCEMVRLFDEVRLVWLSVKALDVNTKTQPGSGQRPLGVPSLLSHPSSCATA